MIRLTISLSKPFPIRDRREIEHHDLKEDRFRCFGFYKIIISARLKANGWKRFARQFLNSIKVESFKLSQQALINLTVIPSVPHKLNSMPSSFPSFQQVKYCLYVKIWKEKEKNKNKNFELI